MNHFNSNDDINMNGSNDEHYRYKMPAVRVKHEGKGKMKKSVLANIKEVCESIGRPPDHLVTYLGQKVSAMAKVEKMENLSYVTGHHDPGQVQKLVLDFIRDVVMCRKCKNPETACHTEGSRKQQALFLMCKGCGKRSDLDSTDRFVKYMISHHAEEASYGHAARTANASIADAATTKKECPKCHHKTSKPICSKCGEKTSEPPVVAEEDAPKRKECPKCSRKTSKSICSKCGSQVNEETVPEVDGNQEPIESIGGYPTKDSMKMAETYEELIGSVRLAIEGLQARHQAPPSLEDFLMQTKVEYFDNSARLDLLGAVVQVLTGNVCQVQSIKMFMAHAGDAAKLQPITVAKEAKSVVATWAGMIEELAMKIGDPSATVGTVISKVQEGVAEALPADAFESSGNCVVVGLLLALIDVNGIASGLLEGCRRLPARSAAMDKFIDFLAEADEEEDEDEEEEEEDDDKQDHETSAMGEAASGAPTGNPRACET